MEFILISHSNFFDGEAEIIGKLLWKYNFTFHLRKPGATVSDYERFINGIPSILHPHIVLHDAFQLYPEYDLKGIHFSTANRNLREKYPDVYATTSCHSVNELKEYDGNFDALFLSPLYPSISKPGYSRDLDMDEVRTVIANKRKSKIFALGGIDENRVSEVISDGFDGMAVCGAVWGAGAPDSDQAEQQFKSIYQCLLYGHIA